MRRLYLHGALAACGGPFDFAAHRPIDLITALATQRPDFARMLQQGRYHIIAGPLSRPRTLAGPQLYQPFCPRTLHLTPAIAGAAKGRGKMVLGLTLLGLSFVPGVASGLSSAFTGVTGNAALGARLTSFGTHLLGQTGQYLMAQGALSSVSPQPHHHAGTLSSDLVAAPATSREGHAIPLIYGQVRLHDPILIETGLTIETTRLT